MKNTNQLIHLPAKQGLYDPTYEHDSCGVGFVAHIKGETMSPDFNRCRGSGSAIWITAGPAAAKRIRATGAWHSDALPHEFMQKVVQADLGVELPAPGSYAAGQRNSCPKSRKSAPSVNR